ncbi:4-demethylwyosine synthase TYW1 [Candidatus Woesearchaeota archaeon]|nr:4-demethylwyosine synthase TYW1 [Candidatus Woesearchaeota archaeon]
MVAKPIKRKLEEQQYRFVGDSEHSAVKVCHYTKKSLKDEDMCYKQKFYGIQSHRCVQMTTALGCANACMFCWRDPVTHPQRDFDLQDIGDDPLQVLEQSMEAQRKMLLGFGGNDKTNRRKYKQAQEPMHFALSLVGESITYPRINELIKEIRSRGKTSFLVTRGQHPDKMEALEPPTQLYISVDAPNKELFDKIDRPFFKDGWERLNRSLELLRQMKGKTRTVVRMTLIKDLNDCDIEGYKALIEKGDPTFIEIKGYMHVGGSMQFLKEENMPTFEEVKGFAEKICQSTGRKIVDGKEESNVVLVMKEDSPDRFLEVEEEAVSL